MARNSIRLSDREIAGKLLMRLANHPNDHNSFCLFWFYDYDLNFLSSLAEDLGLPKNFPGDSYLRRLRKVCRKLEIHGVLYGQTTSCHKEYVGEPVVLKKYGFGDPAYAWRLAPEKHPHYKPMGKVETELEFLLDRVTW